MAGFRCLRWEKAMKTCLGADDPKHGRWKGDPIALANEAMFLPPKDQCLALDYMEEASHDLRNLFAPLWKYCFVQWVAFDAGKEAERKGQLVADVLNHADVTTDIKAMQALAASGGLAKCQTAEKWTWALLEKLPQAGSAGEDEEAVVQAGKEERADGVAAFGEEQFEKAFWHFWQGIRHLARLPEPMSPVQGKLACDLYKNIAATSIHLNMYRVALNTANAALAINPEDPKAWFRKAMAHERLGQEQESYAALEYAGLGSGQPPLTEVPEPPADSSKVLPGLVFVGVGVDSIAAVDLVATLQAELPEVVFPPTFVFDCPTVGDAAKFILERSASAGGGASFDHIVVTIWTAMCRILGYDPVKVEPGARILTEDTTKGILLELLEAYRSQDWTDKVAEVAHDARNDHRAFVAGLKRPALELQAAILESRGFEVNYDGMMRLEAVVVAVAQRSRKVTDLLRQVRVACYGGQNGMWHKFMELS